MWIHRCFWSFVIIGGIVDSLLFFAQVVDLVLPITSSSARFFAIFDIQLGSAATRDEIWSVTILFPFILSYRFYMILYLFFEMDDVLIVCIQWIAPKR
jgi:hypothetical protein